MSGAGEETPVGCALILLLLALVYGAGIWLMAAPCQRAGGVLVRGPVFYECAAKVRP